MLSGRRPGLRAPPTPPDAPTAAWDPRGAALRAAASAPPPPPAASAAASRPPPPPPAAASPRPRASEAAGVSPEIKALQQTRRLLANARERTRVHTISAAFEALRKQVAAGRLARLSVCLSPPLLSVLSSPAAFQPASGCRNPPGREVGCWGEAAVGCRGGWECVEAPTLLVTVLTIWINKGFLFCSCLETLGPFPQRQDGTEGNEINPPKKTPLSKQ